MALDAFFTWRNDRLETKWFSVVGACMGFSHGELSNSKSQEVKPYISLIMLQGVCQPVLLGFSSKPMPLSHAAMLCCAFMTSSASA